MLPNLQFSRNGRPYRLGKAMRDGRDNRSGCREKSDIFSVLARLVGSHFPTSSISFSVSGTTGDGAAFSAGIGSELSRPAGSVRSSPGFSAGAWELSELCGAIHSSAGFVNSSLNASCAHTCAI